MEEQLFCIQQVAGSSPAYGSSPNGGLLNFTINNFIVDCGDGKCRPILKPKSIYWYPSATLGISTNNKNMSQFIEWLYNFIYRNSTTENNGWATLIEQHIENQLSQIL